MPVFLDEKSLPDLIKSNRKKAGISQLELAELAGVGKTLIFNIEKGHTSVHFENLLKVLRVLNIKIHAETPQ
jgi:y4mF family transcriptional regulator